MLNSITLDNDLDKEYVKLEFEGRDDSSDNEQHPVAQIVKPEIVASSVTDSITGAMKQGFIYTAKTIGGCFAAVALAPRAVPVVISYLLPSATVPGVLASTTTASVGVVSFGLGSQVSAKSAEVAWNASSYAVSSTITYLFSGKKTQEQSQRTNEEYYSSNGLRP